MRDIDDATEDSLNVSLLAHLVLLAPLSYAAQESLTRVHLVGEPREWRGSIPNLESGAASFQILKMSGIVPFFVWAHRKERESGMYAFHRILSELIPNMMGILPI
jgi:hypothetical protein